MKELFVLLSLLSSVILHSSQTPSGKTSPIAIPYASPEKGNAQRVLRALKDLKRSHPEYFTEFKEGKNLLAQKIYGMHHIEITDQERDEFLAGLAYLRNKIARKNKGSSCEQGDIR